MTRELTDGNIGDETLKLYFLVAKKVKYDLKKIVEITKIRERDAEVLMVRYKDFNEIRMSLANVGKEFHLTSERIRQMIGRCMRRLRYHESQDSMKNFLVGNREPDIKYDPYECPYDGGMVCLDMKFKESK
jgi:Sigma-70, region 4